ncbi:MAG: response regulator [Chloroflexi bacterium]|nr:response regulator [Chloroflexota bacterium]
MVQVLHLEDDIRLREILQVALRAAEPNLVLKQYINSNDALAYIEQHVHEIDLFILDIRVPGPVDGLDVARRIRGLKCEAPIILTSAFQPPSQNVLVELDCEWYPKPWHIFETTRTLAQVARKFHEERKKAQQAAQEASLKAKLEELRRPPVVDEEATRQLKPVAQDPEFDSEATQQLDPFDLESPDTTPQPDVPDTKIDKPVGRMRPVDIPPASADAKNDGQPPKVDQTPATDDDGTSDKESN